MLDGMPKPATPVQYTGVAAVGWGVWRTGQWYLWNS